MATADGLKNDEARIEWPTVAIATAIYGGWMLVTFYHSHFPIWLLACLGGWTLAWHNSLQHETIHGHPTRNNRINALIGGAPLALWLPHAVYARSHRLHHASAEITDPFDDPEARYLAPGSGVRHTILSVAETLQSTLIGRLTFGPFVTIGRFLIGEAARMRSHPLSVVRDWLPHLAFSALVVGWLHVCGLGITTYALCFIYPGCALSLLRSFAEHRADRDPNRRVAIVETQSPLALLFLNNNLHAAHHDRPDLAWYELPAFHRANRGRLLQSNGGLLYAGYRNVVRRFAFRAHDSIIHPAYLTAPAGSPVR